ncbi:hypothetical protein ACJX0J_033483 [Zea mays]
MQAHHSERTTCSCMYYYFNKERPKDEGTVYQSSKRKFGLHVTMHACFLLFALWQGREWHFSSDQGLPLWILAVAVRSLKIQSNFGSCDLFMTFMLHDLIMGVCTL